MKTIFFLMSLSAFSNQLINAEGWPTNKAHSIIRMIESSDGKFLIGDNGKAIGAYQIQPIMVKEINRIYGTKFKPEDRLCLVKSARIFDLWIKFSSKYGLKKGFTDAQILSTWNSGLRDKPVNKYLEKIENLKND